MELLKDEYMPSYKTIAIDFDGTLCFSHWPELGEPNLPLIHFLKEWKRVGNKLILWTCRAGEPLDSAIAWCGEYGLYFDAINDNLPETIALYGNNSRKISCDYYIDDRAVSLPIMNSILSCHSKAIIPDSLSG